MQRRLAAIMALDVVGYSRLVRANETETVRTLKAVWSEVIDPEISGSRGRVFKRMGDGALAEFGSVVDAIECAVTLQRAMTSAAPEAGGEAVRLRIGVNLGDVLADDDDLFGDGVNVAARLEAEAPPGGVMAADTAYREAAAKVSVAFDDGGELSLKNIDRPVHVWVWRGGTATGKASAEPAAVPERLSIAVLPFDNMSGDPDQEFLADGLSEDLITGLARVRWFLVIARNSTFTYKGQAVDIKKVGAELGVRYVIEGSVRKAGSRIRVTVQLIDAETGAHVWAERYDRELADIFDLQDEITDTIIGAVEPELSKAERSRAMTRPAGSLDAWECYQRGLHETWKYGRSDVEEGIRLLRRATELDPGFASAWGYLAYAYYESVIMGWPDDPDAYLQLGLEAGRKAVASDERDPVAWFGLGRIYMMLGQADDAIAALETAIRLNPSFSQARHGLGMALTLAGRLDEARASLEMVERLSPRDPILWASTVVHSMADIMAGDAEAGLVWARKTLQNPNATGYWPHAVHAAALGLVGETEEARQAVGRALAAKPDLTIAYIAHALPTAEPGGLEPYLGALRAAGLPEGAEARNRGR